MANTRDEKERTRIRSCQLDPRKSSLRRRSNERTNLGKRSNDQCVPASYTAISFFSASIFCDEGEKVISVTRISMYANSRLPKARVVRGSNCVLKY